MSHVSGSEQNLIRYCDWIAFWRTQLTGAFTEAELQCFQNPSRTVKHTLDPALCWHHRLRKRADEQQRLSGMWNATLPVPLDPADDSIFGAPPPPDWSQRQKRAWREKRKFEKLRDSAGDEVVQPGIFVGSAFGDAFAPASVQSTFDAGCIRLSSASKSQKHLKSSCLPLKLYLYWEQGWESGPGCTAVRSESRGHFRSNAMGCGIERRRNRKGTASAIRFAFL